MNKLNINKANLLQSIANNLNLSEINENSNLFKLVNPIITELELLTLNLENNVLRELLINTASLNTLQSIGSELNIYRQNFKSINISNTSGVVEIYLDDFNIVNSGINFQIFERGDTITISSLKITFNEDIYVSSGSSVPISITIESISNSLFIPENTIYTLKPNLNTDNIFQVNLRFNNPIGINNLEESIEDFRVRLLNAKKYGNSSLNSIILDIVQQIPGLLKVELDDLNNGNTIEQIYLYTQNLLVNGFDDYIDNVLVSIFKTALTLKLNYQTQILVSSARPFNIIINIKNSLVNNVNLNNIKNNVNLLLRDYSILSKESLVELLQTNLPNLDINNFSISIKSPSIFENDVLLNNEIINREIGRFFYITEIVGV